jgi:hypothetical protein
MDQKLKSKIYCKSELSNHRDDRTSNILSAILSSRDWMDLLL